MIATRATLWGDNTDKQVSLLDFRDTQQKTADAAQKAGVEYVVYRPSEVALTRLGQARANYIKAANADISAQGNSARNDGSEFHIAQRNVQAAQGKIADELSSLISAKSENQFVVLHLHAPSEADSHILSSDLPLGIKKSKMPSVLIQVNLGNPSCDFLEPMFASMGIKPETQIYRHGRLISAFGGNPSPNEIADTIRLANRTYSPPHGQPAAEM